MIQKQRFVTGTSKAVFLIIAYKVHAGFIIIFARL